MLTIQVLAHLFRSLETAGVRYVVAGGLAVIAHGYERLTGDCDLVLALDDANAAAAFDVFERLGYRPRVPVGLRDFLDVEQRRRWIDEKRMVEFPLFNPDPRLPGIDLFAIEPFDVDAELARATRLPVQGTRGIPVVSLDTLLAMKRKAGRDKDRLDIAALSRIHKLATEP